VVFIWTCCGSIRCLWCWYASIRPWQATRLLTRVHIGSFLPVTLEQLARERGVLRSDGVTSCIASKIPTPAPGSGDGDSPVSMLIRRALVTRDQSQCIVRPFGREISTASFAMYTFSIAVLVQALILVSFSSVADYGTGTHYH